MAKYTLAYSIPATSKDEAFILARSIRAKEKDHVKLYIHSFTWVIGDTSTTDWWLDVFRNSNSDLPF